MFYNPLGPLRSAPEQPGNTSQTHNPTILQNESGETQSDYFIVSTFETRDLERLPAGSPVFL